MQHGFLSHYFEDIAIKRLSIVETDTAKSNQHEFHGTSALRKLFGEERFNNFPLSFIWLGGENEGVSINGNVTWYNARENNPNRSAEWRLYFKNNSVMDLAQVNDVMVIARRPYNKFIIIIVQAYSTFENQIAWLFGENKINPEFNYKPLTDKHNLEVNFATRYILEELGIEPEESDADHLDTIIEPYLDQGFPTTRKFSTLARKHCTDVDPMLSPDQTLLKWVEMEEKLFKRLERYLVSNRLAKGFTIEKNMMDVDSFIKFSLSVHNRRKSRAGQALENHLQEILNQHNIEHARGQITENKSKPDFLFPNIQAYRDMHFPKERLTMLGVKSTCKDRWRQVLTEAKRIKTKHLFTLEPSISESQTNEMQANQLHLVLPTSLHNTYLPSQQKELLSLSDFISIVKGKQ